MPKYDGAEQPTINKLIIMSIQLITETLKMLLKCADRPNSSIVYYLISSKVDRNTTQRKISPGTHMIHQQRRMPSEENNQNGLLRTSKYKEGNNHPSSVNPISLIHNHDKAGNKCYTQDNTDTRENQSV